MNIDSVYNSLKTIGLSIQDYDTFLNFVRDNNNSYEEVVNMIINAKEVKDKKVNYSDFEKHLVDYFKEIQNIINKDSLYTFSNDEDITEFKNFFQEIVDKYIIIYKLKDDKDECKKVSEEIDKIKHELDKYNNGLFSIDSIDRINDLKFNLDLKSMEYKRLLTSIEESTKLMTKYSSKIEFINLINIISKDMEKLSNLMNRLSLTNESIVDIHKVLEKVTYYFETSETECINDINRYNDICVKAGLIKPKVENIEINNNSNLDDNFMEEPVEVKEDVDDILDGLSSSIMDDTKFKISSLNVGDYVTYNGTNSYTDYNNSDKLEIGAVYKVKRVDFDGNGNEVIYLEGSVHPYSVTLFDLVRDYSHSINKIVSSNDGGSLKDDLVNIYRKALNNLSSKNISGYIKNLLSGESNQDNAEELEEETYDDGLLNLDEFSKIYEEVKGKSR